MNGIETALLRVGVSASNALFASWLRGKTPGARPGESLGELLNRRVPGTIQRRRAQRQLDQVADQVTERLQGFLRAEFKEVRENEIIAATSLVSDLFTGVQADANFLLASDLDAVVIENYLRQSGSKKISDAALSSAGEFVFDQVLRETAAYVIEVFTVLPEFSARVYKEILRRETTIATMAEQVLARLPVAGDQAQGFTAEDGAFETEYRRNIARKLDRLELFGATISEFSRRYTLSVAYISLTLANPGPNRLHSTATGPCQPGAGDASRDFPNEERGAQRVEKALGYARQRVLIRGEAGSGKTTLLQWLSVMAAHKEFGDGLKGWNERVPIYLPLRRFASSALPRPEQFLDPVLPNLAGVMPRAWMHRLLKSERGLLLLDGVDELPGKRRTEFAQWFTELVSEFPEMVVIVTSRPAAVEAGWLHDQRMQSFELQPMSLQDIKSLIDHWHFAISKDIEEPEELRSLAGYRENLKAVMEDRRPIRSLATNPLMCALICALHRDRRAQLPRDRLELYRIALEMLLERRDRERQVPELVDVNLTYREKELMLEDLAYWLIRNGQSDATDTQTVSRIAKMLPQIPQVQHPPDEILTYLIERSGILRSPMAGRIDFLHRSFQEFLAARAAVENDDIPLLAKNGVDDQWREVIILAAGHARPKERESLIRDLLEAGRSDPDHRHHLFLLAVACLETATQLSPDLRGEVKNALTLVVPPKNQTDATAIAAAKELATPFLSGHADREPEIVSACVHALALIGDADAMKGIKEYVTDRRSPVAREVIRAWPLFPAEEYARKILARSPLDRGAIDLTDSSYVDYLGLLARARRVRVQHVSDVELRKLGSFLRIRHLHIADVRAEDFSWIANQRLETLEIENFIINSWNGLDFASGLRRFSLRGCRFGMSGSPKGLAKLDSLAIHTMQMESLDFLSSAGRSLRSLSISECANLTSLHGVETLDQLEELVLEDNIGLLSVDRLRGLRKLRKISVRGGFIRDLRPLENIAGLEVLKLDNRSDHYLGALPHKPGLRIIDSE